MNAKRKKRIITIFIILFVLCFGQPYYKPAYSGRVVDLETGEPIVGAMVDVEYWIGGYGLVEQYSEKIGMRRAMTDKNGYFELSKFFSLVGIFNFNKHAIFNIRKENYTFLNSIEIGECLSSGCEERVFESKDKKRKISMSSNLIKLRKKNLRWNLSLHHPPANYKFPDRQAPWTKVFGPSRRSKNARAVDPEKIEN